MSDSQGGVPLNVSLAQILLLGQRIWAFSKSYAAFPSTLQYEGCVVQISNVSWKFHDARLQSTGDIFHGGEMTGHGKLLNTCDALGRPRGDALYVAAIELAELVMSFV